MSWMTWRALDDVTWRVIYGRLYHCSPVAAASRRSSLTLGVSTAFM